MTLHTINVSGSERHDGEKPYTVVVDANSMPEAKRSAWLWFVWNIASECGQVAADGTIPSWPDLAPVAVSRNDDVVIVDCAEFRCHIGEPFKCGDPCHYDENVKDRSPLCMCSFNWYWVHDEKPMDLDRLRELGYQIPDIAPEENQW